MHHLFPLAKGDPLCPLGFHPQVRWPTRCKRCFRDYKEHGGRKREDDFTGSSPTLPSWNSPSSRGRDDDNGTVKDKTARSWSSTQNLSHDSKKEKTDQNSGFSKSSASWTSTPDLGGLNDSTTAVTLSLRLPRKKPPDTGQSSAETNIVTLRRPSASPPPAAPALSINKNDSLAERVRKMQLFKAQSNSFEKESSQERDKEQFRRSLSRSREEERTEKAQFEKAKESDVKFLMQVKSARAAKSKNKPPIRGGPFKDEKDKDGSASDSSMDDETISNAGTTTTETTLVDYNIKEYQDQIDSLKEEIDMFKKKCERLEKEKSDILLRRLANLDTTASKLTGRSSEVLKLQQKVNDLLSQVEDARDDKKSLSLRVKELETELEARPSPEVTSRQMEQLRGKLVAAETLCEELMDENEDMKKELRELEEEIEEMQDNFREDQADEYSSLRRELEQTIKNCRVLSFKLKKTERRTEQLELEKQEQEKKLLEIVGGQGGLDRVAKIKDLELELSRSTEVALRLQRELQEANAKLSQMPQAPPANQKRAPSLAAIGKSNSTESKVSRASLTRGGSQEDPQQLLRDLQDSLEREADLREQLKNAEEEAVTLRKKASRVEDDNESLLLQLKKMATKARTRKLSPTPPVNRLSIELPIDKDEGISDEEDPAELRILLELNEQEAAVLRRKVEELEHESEYLKTQVKDLTDKLSTHSTSNKTTVKKLTNTKSSSLSEEKVKVLEDEVTEVRKKLIEKERDCERLHSELSMIQKRPKGPLVKSKSLDDQQNVDLKRQLQIIEQEANILRTKSQTFEAENEKLLTENNKLQLLRGTKALKSDKSLEQSAERIAQLEVELEIALGKVKELESVKEVDNSKNEKRVTFGGVLTKKDEDKLKMKQDELDKLKLNLTKVEKEKNLLAIALKELKDDAIKLFKPRTPKKPTDLTTKLQLKKMVEDLENEIGQMYIVMKNADISNSSVNKEKTLELENNLEEIRKRLSQTESELNNEKNKLQTDISKLKDINTKLEKDQKTFEEKLSSCEKDKKKLLDEANLLQEGNKRLEVQINKLNFDLKSATSKQSAMSECMKKVEELKKDMEEKDKELEKLKKQVQVIPQLEQDKNKLIREIGDKTKKIVELEKKLKDAEDKCKRTEKQLLIRKEKVTKLEKELSEEKEQGDNQRRMSVDWTSEKDDLQNKLMIAEAKVVNMETSAKEELKECEAKILILESHIAAKDVHIQQLEVALHETSGKKYDDGISSVEMAQMQEKMESAKKDLAIKEEELVACKKDLTSKQNELTKMQDQITEIKQDMMKLENDKKELENSVKVQKKEASYWEGKASEFETDLQAERKKVERMRVSHDKESKNKEVELATLKGKLRTLELTSGAGAKRISELKQDFEEKMKKLEHELAVERQEYEELTTKYEILEEEHVVTKAKLTIEKETAQGELLQVQRELNCSAAELKSLQETYNNQSEAWEKEKNELQDKLSILEERLCGGGWEVEKARLITKLDIHEKEVKKLTEERDLISHLQENTKRELEELRQKVEDYEKVHKVQRSLAAQNKNMEEKLKSLQSKLDQVDKTKKTDLAECKARYESQMQSMQDELQSLQNQVSRFRRERDNYKQMLDAASKPTADINFRAKRNSATSLDELEEGRSRIASLEQQVACLEDELCEVRLTASKARTDLVSERSTAEVRLSEMQSRLNEFEEDRLLASGRTKVAGTRTRMELAWQKERDEQQRLLQETSTLARDLRQTLFEVERERDKERLDMKRRIDQLKKTTEEETEENKRKVSELQCDLLELRDAHAKLRTTNEKLRREKERHEREREQHRLLVMSLKRTQQEDDRKISFLLEQIEDLIKQSPELLKHYPQAENQSEQKVMAMLTPTPPRRNRSKSRSREATPESGISDSSLHSTLVRLQRATEELRASRLAERQRRQANTRRAVSTEPRDAAMIVNTVTVTPRPSNGRTPSLKKRSVSLEQTTKEQVVIWKTEDDSMSSMQSLENEDPRHFIMQRDTSMDSRLSGGSTQSDVLPASDKKKKKGIFGKLKQLTKSRSIDDQVGPEIAEFRPIGSVSQGSDSDMSAAGSKRDLRGKLSDIFNRKSSQASKDRKRELSTPVPERTTSVGRPLNKNGSATQLNPTTTRSESGAPRAASMTPGMLRKAK